jgi:hypothetical protein
MEVMAYSQYFIHHKALSSTLSTTLTTSGLPYSCTTGTNCLAVNVLRSTLLIWNTSPVPASPNTPCCIYSTPQADPMLTVNIKADVKIEFVVIIPSDQETSNVTDWQKNIEIWIVDSAGLQ